MVKLAAILIVKGTVDEAPHLKRVLENIAPHVDGIFLNINAPASKKPDRRVLNVGWEFTDDKNIIQTTWHDDFAEARNANLAQVPEDYTHIIWLDTDDIIDKPEKIKKVLEISERYDSLFVDYLYDRDEENNPTTVHLVARVFKNNGGHQWKGRIHETLIETRSVLQGATKDFTVIHQADEDRKDLSLARNVRMLEMQLEDEEDSPDPRTFYYLASTYMDVDKMQEAKEMFLGYLQMSGWDQERSAAATKLGRIFLQENNTSEAKRWFANAVAEDPENPEPRVELGSLELELKQYHKARNWLENVEKMDKNMTTLERNPISYTFRTYLLLADCYLNMGGKWLDKAQEYGKKALKYKRKDKNVKAFVKLIDNVIKEKKLTEGYLQVFQSLRDGREEEKLSYLKKAIPKQIDDNPIMVKIRDDKPYDWPKKSIVIMTGDTIIDNWGPWSLKEGIGGSEEAVIRLSGQLSKLGYKVVVFAKPGANSGEDENGVMWRNFWECNLEDNFDIFVSWRSPGLFDNKIKARKKYLWLHDVIEAGEFTKHRLANLDKVIVLSKYHRSLFPMIPEKKIFLSTNGIDPEDFEKCDGKFKRDPHHMIYASSHVRGLNFLYTIWPNILKKVPDATLNVYYGRESYDAVHRGNPERIKWMDDMQATAKELKGVTDWGKVSQEKITEESFKAGIWPYPCPFPEISCITAMKCQAAGAVPVSSDFAALAETVQYGTKVHMKQMKEGLPVGTGEDFLKPYEDALIDMLTHPEKQETIRQEMMVETRKHSWENVAKSWDQNFQS